MSVVRTMEDKCKACYSCVRDCPAKAIKVEVGQSRVVEERCISCGNCVRVCSQNAKQIVTYVPQVEGYFNHGEEVVALLAPSFPASFPELPGWKFSSLLKELGFAKIEEVTVGIELTVPYYHRFLESHREPAISSYCPAVVGLIERHFPSLIPNLVTVDSAVLASAKYMRWKHKGAKLVFIGPCIAKKEEMAEFGQGALDAVLTFKELKAMLEERGMDWEAGSSSHVRRHRRHRRHLPSLFPVSGGLARNLDPWGEYFTEQEVAIVEGKEDCLEFLQNLQDGKVAAKFVDIMLCRGCIDGPEIASSLDLFSRKYHVFLYAQEKRKDRLGQLPPLDLVRRFTNQHKPLPVPTEAEVTEILRYTNKVNAEDQLNCGSCGYRTCRDKAVAVYQGLAEIDMCLPYLIEKSRGELEVCKERLNREQIEQRQSLLLGESLAIQELRRLGLKASLNNANILIQGESGVGKEVFARFVHQMSSRRDGPFVGINCAALPENLLESELFGYEEGAFTGAKKGGKPGKFELAQGGTILLDEVGDFPLTMQAKLLRVLQEREFERVGGIRTIKLDARVIAATNRDLSELVREGKFRMDLLYRLDVISVRLPALRERKEDILLLAGHFLHEISRQKKLPPKIFSEEALECLVGYDWPGNVRELENVIERLLYMMESPVIRKNHLPPSLNKTEEEGTASGFQTLKDAVRELEKELIAKALYATQDNRVAAANLLGVPRATFYLKLKEYGLLEKEHNS